MPNVSGIPGLPGLPGAPAADRCLVMGVVNVTPDSFSDGGQWYGAAAAIQHGLDLVAQGADIVDVGGEFRVLLGVLGQGRMFAAAVALDELLRQPLQQGVASRIGRGHETLKEPV